MDLIEISRALAGEVDALDFSPPVAYAYNPLDYAREPHEEYLRRYGAGAHDVLLVGMNPGPNGMAQTGVPFGDVVMVRDWMGIEGPVGHPPHEHPNRPIRGFACGCREASGTKLWGWARDRFGTAETFFARFYVANYCPLLFLAEDGKNLTPDKLPAADRAPLYAACDLALRRTIEQIAPRFAVGIGNFATKRIQTVLPESEIIIGAIPHPSPANPQSHHGWPDQVNARLHDLGVL
ncbi:MAG TPA: uracil-DNA glycosylase family protein [Armatimonadota bacterium]